MAASSSLRKFQWGQVLLQWSVGMIVSTPLIAVFQGTLLVTEYRTKFKDLPRPIQPARGVSVSVTMENDHCEGKTAYTGTNKSKTKNKKINIHQQPLRILVVGDSLAAGVGISKSGIPVLPESIARALSRAYGGRAVVWTCMGTPGISASQIIYDINKMESNRPRRLENILKEWQGRRRRWQHLQELKAKQRQNDGLENNHGGNDKNLKKSKSKNRHKPMGDILDLGNSIENRVRRWWLQISSRVREGLSDIKEIIQDPVVGDDDNGDKDHEENGEDRHQLVRKGGIFRRDSVDPNVASQYDVAVVLLGLNDLKDSFMPHMTQGSHSSIEDGTERVIGGLNVQLHGVLQALRKRMGRMELPSQPKESSPAEKSESKEILMQRPLIVVPELPIAPLEAFQLYPLCWFLLPLFGAMEKIKMVLSLKFPDHVVFVQQPDLKWWSDAEAGLGSIHENMNKEKSLLRLTDVAQASQRRIQQLMKKHHDADMKSTEGSKKEDGESSSGVKEKDHSLSDHHIEESNKEKLFSFIAVDKMHPNDEGYELWGQFIAAAVVRHWKAKERG